MGTTADKLEYLDGTKSAIKQAIVGKGVAVPDGTTFRAYAEKIGSIVKVPSLSNPGSASDLRSGKQLAGADGSVITGTLAEVTQATPSISVSSGGLITASATQSGGIVASGSKSATKQLTTQAAKTVTPGTTNQTAVASGRYTTGAVTVKGDANLKAENIAEGVSIFGITGIFGGGGMEILASGSKNIPAEESVNVTLPAGTKLLLAMESSNSGGGWGGGARGTTAFLLPPYVTSVRMEHISMSTANDLQSFHAQHDVLGASREMVYVALG